VTLRTTWRCAAAAVLALASNISAAAPSTAAIEAEIAELSKTAGGVVGVAAWRLDGKGARVTVNADERFPMASTFKVAVAGAIFAAVDAGRLKLDQMVAIERADIVPSEVIADRFIHPGVSLSVANLLELMLTQSDNTATDVLTRLAGGPAAVTAWVKQQGVQGQRIDRDTAGILRGFFDLPAGTFLDAIAAAEKSNPKLGEMGSLPKPSFDDDPRDTSTPNAMAQLLTRIFSGRALSPASTTELIGMMERCRTGKARLRGKLPAGTIVADKTGTIGGSVNDVGVITLPAGQGQIVIAVFVKKSELPFERRELAIAEIARSVRDYYLFGAGAE
jgi:beta-lactamase class A